MTTLDPKMPKRSTAADPSGGKWTCTAPRGVDGCPYSFSCCGDCAYLAVGGVMDPNRPKEKQP